VKWEQTRRQTVFGRAAKGGLQAWGFGTGGGSAMREAP
jgi:hypothetical protein